MDAVLYSGFPERFVRNRVIPKLRRLGVEVICVGDADRPTERCVARADLILVMHEMASHSGDKAIRIIAEAHGKRVAYLPRKASSWRERLGLQDPPPSSSEQKNKQEGHMEAQADSRPNGRHNGVLVDALRRSGKSLDDMLKAIVQMSKVDRFGYREMAPRLQPFFDGTELTPGRLKDFVGAVCKRPDVPGWFVDWRKTSRGGPRPGTVRKQKKTRTARTEAAEIEVLANEYAAENTALKETIKELRATADLLQESRGRGQVWESEVRQGIDALEVLAKSGAVDTTFVFTTVRKLLKIG